MMRQSAWYAFALSFSVALSFWVGNLNTQDAWSLQREGKYDLALAAADKRVEEMRAKYHLKQNDPAHIRDTLFADELVVAAVIHQLNFDWDKAILLNTEAVEILAKYYKRSNRAHTAYMVVLDKLGFCNFYAGKPEETERIANKMLAIGIRYSENYNDRAYVDFLPYLEVSLLFHFAGNTDKAEKVLLDGIAFYRKKLLASNKKINSLATSLLHSKDYFYLERYYYGVIDCAQFYMNAGLFYKQEPLLEEFIKMSELKMEKDSPSYGLWLNSMSSFYAFMGRYDYAYELIAQAEKDFPEGKKKRNTAYVPVLTNKGIVYWYKNDFVSAESCFLQARELGAKDKAYSKSLDHTVINPINVSFCYYKNGRIDKAKKMLLTALHGFEYEYRKDAKYRLKNGWYQTMLMNLGLFYQAEKKYDSAEYYLTLAHTHNGSRLTQHTSTARHLGKLYDETRQSDKARALFNESMNLHFTIMDKNIYHFSERERGDLYKEIAVTANAFDQFIVRNYSANPSLAAEMYNLQLKTKGILFNSSKLVHSNVIASGDTVLLNRFRRWQRKKEYLNKVYQLSAQEKTALKINQQELETDINRMEKDVARRSAFFASAVSRESITWKQVQAKLAPQEAAIEIVRTEIEQGPSSRVVYAVLIVKPQMTEPQIVILENGKELEGKFFNYYRNCISTKTEDTNSYTQFWATIEKQLKGVKRVFVSPDGIYNKISLRTLRNNDTGKFAIDELDIQIVASTKDIIGNVSALNKPTDVLFFGHPDYSNRPSGTTNGETSVTLDSIRGLFGGSVIADLPGTKIEVLGIESILLKKQAKTTRFLGADASENNIKKIKSPQILHVATHGFFLPDIDLRKEEDFMGFDNKELKENALLRSGLLLAGAQQTFDGKIGSFCEDGVLTAYEAMNLNLEGTELVVLSACETGLGEIKNGEGVYGLQRALMAAGARSVLMSLWKVDDNATQKLMTLFYTNWSNGMNKREAFNRAQTMLKSEFPDPVYWGAFVFLER